MGVIESFFNSFNTMSLGAFAVMGFGMMAFTIAVMSFFMRKSGFNKYAVMIVASMVAAIFVLSVPFVADTMKKRAEVNSEVKKRDIAAKERAHSEDTEVAKRNAEAAERAHSEDTEVAKKRAEVDSETIKKCIDKKNDCNIEALLKGLGYGK